MKLIAILTTLVGGLASVHAQHHVPAPATFNANINGGINSPTSSNIDIEGVATIIDKANDNTERKLHDMLTSVKDVMDEKFGLDLIDGLVLGGNGTRRLSKSHKSDKGIDIINEVLALVLIAVFLLVELFGYEGYDTSMLDGLLGGAGVEEEEDIADEITAAHHGHDGSSSKTAKSGGTDASAKTTKESKSSKSGGGSTCSLGVIVPGSVTNGNPCCEDADCADGASSFCLVEGNFFCFAENSSSGSVDCSTGNTCTDNTQCNTGAPRCGSFPIDFCTTATAPATGTCFIINPTA